MAMKRHSQKTWNLVLAALIVLIIGGMGAYALGRNNSMRSHMVVSSSGQPNMPQHTTLAKLGQPITVTGTVRCLTPTSKTSSQDNSCAIGIKGDDGKDYAITSTDSTQTGSLMTGSRVQVIGTLTQSASPYNIAGSIQVSSVQHL